MIYFPSGGMFSLLAVMRDGKAIETATVGREGVIGAMAGLGLYQVAGSRGGPVAASCQQDSRFGVPARRRRERRASRSVHSL